MKSQIQLWIKKKWSISINRYFVVFVLIFLSINLRQKSITNYNCEICADKVGYYMYLPALFYYGFEAKNYPEKLDQLHGMGFYFDYNNNRVKTKFTSGVAILQTPFYSLGVLTNKIFGLNLDPFSKFFLYFINLGAAFYLVLGLYFLKKWLNFYYDNSVSLWTTILIFLGTNLLYYTLDESLMSHLYSFFAFSLLLFSFKTYLIKLEIKYYIIFAFSFSLAILIRPTNLLYGLIVFFLDIDSIFKLKGRILLFLNPKNILILFTSIIIVFLPQILYWKFAFDHYIIWSYVGEGFIYWKNPQFLIVWFSPQSGLFPYTPIMFFSLIYMFFIVYYREKNSILILLTFLSVSYICASWSNPFFGVCNFGKRPMVEYYPIIMLPIASYLEKIKKYKKSIKNISYGLLAFTVIYNLLMFQAFNTCFPGSDWEWNKFVEIIHKAFLFS